MASANVFASLFTTAATRLIEHQSRIAEVTAAELVRSIQLPILKPPQLVPQCKALQNLFSDASEPNDSLLKEISKVQAHLHWSDSSGGIKSSDVRELLAFVELVGPTGMVVNANCRAGILLQLENTQYPDHYHAAEELYLALSGTGLWFRESEPGGKTQSPGDFIYHKSNEIHAMHSSSEPLLAFWCWSGDIDFGTYNML